MPETDIASSVASDLANAMTDYSVDPLSTDAGGDQKEYTYQNTDWSQYYGYYLTIPEFKTAVDAKAIWTLGAGFEADELTMMHLDSFRGNGKDSFNSILKNMIKVKTVGGDSFAEIITGDDDIIINLKPLDPESMVIVHDRKGRIKRYEQVSKTKTPNKKFKPEQIFHLSHDRVADEIHGTKILKALEWLILARNEAMNDWKRVLHRNVDPVNIFHLDTDDTTEIAAFKTKMDAARGSGENMYIPKGAVEVEAGGVAPNATLNPLQWINQLNDYFFQAVMVPQILFGNAKDFTDASGKIVYLAYEQSVKAEQLYIEEQVLNQLNFEISLTFPASLQNDLISGDNKDPMTGAAEPDDTVAELEGA